MKEKVTVMVVDDDDTIREFVEWALSEEGYAVVSVADGSAALSIAERVHPDLILLDLRMPGMNGAAFASTYRRLPEPHASIVVMTAARDSRDSASGIEAAGHLDKPFDLDDLLAVVERHVATPR